MVAVKVDLAAGHCEQKTNMFDDVVRRYTGSQRNWTHRVRRLRLEVAHTTGSEQEVGPRRSGKQAVMRTENMFCVNMGQEDIEVAADRVRKVSQMWQDEVDVATSSESDASKRSRTVDNHAETQVWELDIITRAKCALARRTKTSEIVVLWGNQMLATNERCRKF